MSHPAPRSPGQAVRWVGRAAIVAVHGDIDLSHSVEFQHDLLLLIDQKPQRLIVDLTGVPYMDSSGVASLVKVLSRARKAGTDLTLMGLSPRVKSLFQITRLDGVFHIVATEKDALG